MVARLLNEGDDRGQVAGLGGERREPRIVKAHRDFRGEVLEQVAGQAELGEDDQSRPLPARLLQQLTMARQVLVEKPQSRSDLCEGDPKRGDG